MILHLYIARRFFRSLGIVLAVFLAILLPLDIAEHLRRIDDNLGMGAVVRLSLLNLPGAVYGWLPLFVMLATLLMFLGLARSSELVVVRASGRSALSAASAPVLSAFLVGVLGLLVLNPLVASTTREYDLSMARYDGREERTVSVSAEGLWLRQGTTQEQTVIHARGSNSDGTHLFVANFFTFDDDGLMVQRLSAEEATLQDGAWTLIDVKRWPLLNIVNPEAASESFASYVLPSTLTADQIRDSFGKPETVPIYELPGFIDQLNAAGFAALQHRIWYQMQLSNPLMLSAMVLIAAGFTMGHTRFGRTGLMVLGAILLGFGVYFIRDFAEVLGQSGQIPAAMVAWAPPVAAIMLALGLLLHTEDG